MRLAFTAAIAATSFLVAAGNGSQKAVALQPDASGVPATSGAWGQALNDAGIVKANLQDPNYQYPLIGNGGLAYMPGPTGFTDVRPSGAPYAPIISSDSWWSSSTQAAEPFHLTGGYTSGSGVAPGTIDSFKQNLDVGAGVLTSTLQVTPPTGSDAGTTQFSSSRTEFVTPGGVLVIEVSDSTAHSFAVQIGGSGSLTYGAGATDVVATTSGAGPSGQLALAVAADGSGVSIDAASGTVTASVGPDQPATFYVAAAGVDSANPETDAVTAASTAAMNGYDAESSETGAFWSTFWGASSITVPDADMMKWYVRGQYYLASLMANAVRPPGTTGPSLANGGDVSLESGSVFDSSALLTANEGPVASAFGNWIEAGLSAAEALAPDYTESGTPTPGAAKYPWLSGYAGTEDASFGPSPVQNDWEAFPSANAALIDLRQAQYTADPERLARAEHILAEVTQYQLDNSAQDPSLADAWVNQQSCCATASGFVQGAVADQAALRWSLGEAAALGVGPTAWSTYAHEVYLPVGWDGTRQTETIASDIGDAPSMDDTTASSLTPSAVYHVAGEDSSLTNPTLANEVGSSDFGNTLSRAMAAVTEEASGNGDAALRLLEDITSATSEDNVGGADVWDDTYFSTNTGDAAATPDVGATGAFDAAVQGTLLAGASLSSITVFPALPETWQAAGASFSDLQANGDLSVSGSYSEAGTTVTITNNGPTTANRRLLLLTPANAHLLTQVGGGATTIVGGRFASTTMSIAPGATDTLTYATVQQGAWTTVDDFSPSIGYSSGWAARTGADGFINGSAHYTIEPGATADFAFDGTAVQVIGDCNTDHGQFTVSIDGRMRGWYDAWCSEQRTDQVLFEADGLTAGNHTIEITASGVQDQQATGPTDPETGSTIPDDLLTLDAINYGNFGVSSIRAPATSPAATTDSALVNGLAQNEPAAAGAQPEPLTAGARSRVYVTFVQPRRNGQVAVGIACRGAAGDCVVTLALRANRATSDAKPGEASPRRGANAKQPRTVVLRRMRLTESPGETRTIELRADPAVLRSVVHGSWLEAWLEIDASGTNLRRPVILRLPGGASAGRTR